MGTFGGLPVDILQLIAEKLVDHVDVLRFGAVCRQFSSIVTDNLHRLPLSLPLCLCILPSKPPPLPLLMQCSDSEGAKTNFFSISNQRNHEEFLVPEIRNKWFAGSSHGWLCTVDIQGRGIQLVNPLTRAQIPLPSLDAFQHPNGGFNTYDFNDFGFVEKVVILSNPSNKRRNSNDDDDCMLAMAIISNFGVLSFCRVGDDKWTNIEDCLTHIQDVIYHKGQIYGVNYMGIAVTYDFAGDKKMKQIANSPDEMISVHRYLVESTYGDLLQVVRVIDYADEDEEDENDYQTAYFVVYKLEAVEKPVKPEGAAYRLIFKTVPSKHDFNFKWVEMDSLGDQALFLGKNDSLCVRAAEYEGCKPNCIYYTDHGLMGHRAMARGYLVKVNKKSVCDMGIYDVVADSFQSFSQLNVKYRVPPMWILPNPL